MLSPALSPSTGQSTVPLPRGPPGPKPGSCDTFLRPHQAAGPTGPPSVASFLWEDATWFPGAHLQAVGTPAEACTHRACEKTLPVCVALSLIRNNVVFSCRAVQAAERPHRADGCRVGHRRWPETPPEDCSWLLPPLHDIGSTYAALEVAVRRIWLPILPTSLCLCLLPTCVPKCPWDYTAKTEVTVHTLEWQACDLGLRGHRRKDAGSQVGTCPSQPPAEKTGSVGR